MKVSIIGATGYSGQELIRYLLQHPYVEIVSLHSQNQVNVGIGSLYPHLERCIDLNVAPICPETIMETSDCVFFATPSKISRLIAEPFLKANFPVIDLSGDFRLKSAFHYEKWYQATAVHKEWLPHFDYGLAEERQIPKSKHVANPGCYATVAELAFAPLLKNDLIHLNSIIIDGKSGLSGAGKRLTQETHFVEAHDNMSVYKMNSHQHIPEILQQFKLWHPKIKKFQFTTSLIPVTRGIFLTGYAQLKKDIKKDELSEYYDNNYANAPFVRLQNKETFPQLKQVIGTNFCDIGLAINQDTGIVTVVATIDNLGKGSAGQAVQNLNIYAGFPETSGLINCPVYP